ncbi:Rieske (2Fe-2S) protein [Peterkaempfera bronchialis]|uniref:Rieske (2Fe-2S) protein n=1 Tax=Peterkaempfera bronchialis TaxID=2126346 RepID=UPI003C2FF5F0
MAAAEVKVGGAVRTTDPATGDAVYVLQPQQGRYTALSAVCPHAQCVVNAPKDGKLVCPCHNSVFDAATGARLEGPAATGLATYGITRSGDRLQLGKRQSLPGPAAAAAGARRLGRTGETVQRSSSPDAMNCGGGTSPNSASAAASAAAAWRFRRAIRATAPASPAVPSAIRATGITMCPFTDRSLSDAIRYTTAMAVKVRPAMSEKMSTSWRFTGGPPLRLPARP